ncbi:MAG: hypothetical protein HQL95_01865 [Magnetococcales bacterium]|nr:hypothetical protein [Magnetococcales bacterium]
MNMVASLFRWPDPLASARSLGYPFFLYVNGLLLGNQSMMVHLQTAMHVLAILLFHHALRSFGFSRWQSFFAALPLFWLNRFDNRIMTESLSHSWGLITISSFLLLNRPGVRHTYGWWILLIVAMMLTYHIKPANLPYILTIPVMAIFLHLYRTIGLYGAPDWRGTIKTFALHLGATGIPFLLYGLLRWKVVGHFGLVAYLGFNLLGFSAAMVKPDMVPLLSTEVQPLALAIIERSKTVALEEPVVEYVLGYQMINSFNNFNTYVWRIGAPAANSLFTLEEARSPLHSIRVDRLFTSFSFQVIRLQFKEYLRWVVSGFYFSLLLTISLFQLDVWAILFFAILLLSKLVALLRPGQPQNLPTKNHHPVTILATLTLLLYFPLILLCALVESPLERYVYNAALLLPSLLSLTIWQLIADMRR